MLLIRGAAGEPEYAPKFEAQLEAWKQAAGKSGAEVLTISGESTPPETDLAKLEKLLAELPKTGPAPLWIVLMGHGTWDGRLARFNLEGPDLSAMDLAAWLKPVERPLALINTSSSSAPFMAPLAGPGRVIITATKSGNEKNYARFGESLAQTLTDPAADQDQDGQTSLLEWFLAAANRTAEFYLSEGRIQTEHALIDDNGDGKGTPAEWFRGLNATTRSKDNTPLDGARAHLRTLQPDAASQQMTATQLAERDRLETEISALRGKKEELGPEEYYQKLDTLLVQLAALYAPVE